jgi:hypothetical protein
MCQFKTEVHGMCLYCLLATHVAHMLLYCSLGVCSPELLLVLSITPSFVIPSLVWRYVRHCCPLGSAGAAPPALGRLRGC